MRRKEKSITDFREIERIVESEKICRLGLTNGIHPYIVPVNYGYRNNMLYIHSSPLGKKIDFIKKNNLVCFEIESGVRIITAEDACSWDTHYVSVIGYGKAEIIRDRLSIINGLDVIMKHQSGRENWHYDQSRLGKMVIIKISIESMSGKRNPVTILT